MRFRFNERKSAQAAAYLIRRHEGSLNYMKLLKLLYLADRRVLVERGRTVTGDRMVSMDHGPVLSLTYSRISEGPLETPSPWFDYISAPSGYDVSLVNPNPETDELSQYELRILDEVDDEFGALDKWVLRDLTHKLPEWVDPEGSSIAIRPETILREYGKPEEEIERMTEEAEDVFFIDRYSR